MNLLDTTVS